MPGGPGSNKKDPHLLDLMDEILRDIDEALDDALDGAPDDDDDVHSSDPESLS